MANSIQGELLELKNRVIVKQLLLRLECEQRTSIVRAEQSSARRGEAWRRVRAKRRREKCIFRENCEERRETQTTRQNNYN